MDKAKLVEIYCVVDEFCKGADRYMALKTLVEDGKRRRHRKPMMSDSEVMTILTMFHLSRETVARHFAPFRLETLYISLIITIFNM